MKGVIFNLLEELVSREHGDETWDDLLEASGLEGAYTSLGSYPDEDLTRLVGSASEALGVPREEVVRWFGREAVPLFAQRYPHFFEPHRSTRDFLLTLNDIIHPEVRKIYPGADVPVFDFQADDPEGLTMGYHSERRLCALAEGLIEGAAAHYGETAAIAQPTCMNRGDEKCVLEISLS